MSMKISDFKNNEKLRKFAEDADAQGNSNGKLDTQNEKSIFSENAVSMFRSEDYTDINDEDILDKMKYRANFQMIKGSLIAVACELGALAGFKRASLSKKVGQKIAVDIVLSVISAISGLAAGATAISYYNHVKDVEAQLADVKDAKEVLQQ